MTPRSTRRSFLATGALATAPLSLGAAGAAETHEALKRRAQDLEDEAAIRRLHADWIRSFNAGAADPALDGAVRAIAPDLQGEPDAVELAANGRTATGRFRCLVEIATELPRDCTLGQMAHAQGSGFVRSTERRLLTAAYIKRDKGWIIGRLNLASA